MGRLKQISSVVISISLAFFALGGVATLLFSRLSTGWKALNVTTGSMRPDMRQGSLVFVHRVPEATLKVGDVITYTNPSKPQQTITHRIVANTLVGGKVRGFITKGDANQSADPPIVSGMVVGKRVAFVPYLGKILSWTHTLWGIALLIYLPALLIIIEELKRLSQYYKEQAPYRLPSFERRLQMMAKRGHSKAMSASMGLGVIMVCVFVGLFSGYAVASITSNPVMLSHNTLIAAGVTQGGGGNDCNVNNHNSVNFTSNNNQTATSGEASSNNNTNSGSTTSGNANNTSNTNVTITTINTGSCHQTNP